MKIKAKKFILMPMDILFASNNQHKKEELENLLQPHKLHLPQEFGITFTCAETGTTYVENARQKAEALKQAVDEAKLQLNMPILADDSGLTVDALPGELGIHTARYGSRTPDECLSAEEKNKLLLKNLSGKTNRNARFECDLLLLIDEQEIIATGIAEGKIKEEISTSVGGFGYDPVFFSNEANGCFADLGTDVKNLYSHRAKAAKLLLKQLDTIQENNPEAIPLRQEISESDKWDLSLLYKTEQEFQTDLDLLQQKTQDIIALKGKLAESPNNLLKALKWTKETGILAEKLGNFAYLNYSSQMDNPDYRKNVGMYTRIATELAAQTGFINPEILSIKEIESWIEKPEFDNYRVSLKKLLREKSHILSEKEESLLARQSELASISSDTFEALTNSDMNFGDINGKPLSQSTYSVFMQNSDRNIRKQAYFQFYKTFEQHKQTLSMLYSGSVKQDIFNAKVRGFNSSLEASLYPDNVPTSVYMGLIDAVHKAFPLLHRYYKLKKQICKLDDLRHYDVYVPMSNSVQSNTSYDSACNIIVEALSPLGSEYTQTLFAGLTKERWVDKYENQSKRSGAFSSGGFIGNPYILLNYNPNNLSDVFTLAHEGGHSMHTYYSKLNNPFSCYNYTIFEAEVASTFNEQLLSNYLVEHAENQQVVEYIISKQLDDMVATLFRQTMFAEFELLCHTQQENGEILTTESIRANYRNLLVQYFGNEMIFEEFSDLECLRIPHFYNAFYVYKYATGISAAIALSEKVLHGSTQDKLNYLNFLKSGGSKYPIESLKLAGVDMTEQKPIEDAISKFEKLLDTREKLLF